ncbi:hypothetical protein JZ751_021093 [Albula glossodonta]|uniref:Tetraspanin n=1 Tax=Albula glossodonta TaxID=121402 RepID=A0A8T2PK59_9TELE|nr:hypothetical protein JZ751_021093 [Albula glossodonta]
MGAGGEGGTSCGWCERFHNLRKTPSLRRRAKGRNARGVYILIAVGAVMMFVGFLGCYGAIQESQCLLGTFFACLVILFACEVAAGVWGYMNKDSISKEMINFYDAAYDKVVADPENNQAAATVLKAFHESLDCCGKGDFMGVFNTIGKDVCPKDSLINLKALTSIFEMIFSMVLCCGIRNSPVY